MGDKGELIVGGTDDARRDVLMGFGFGFVAAEAAVATALVAIPVVIAAAAREGPFLRRVVRFVVVEGD